MYFTVLVKNQGLNIKYVLLVIDRDDRQYLSSFRQVILMLTFILLEVYVLGRQINKCVPKIT